MRRDDLQIQEPCHADWDAMSGDEVQRHCSACQLDVHHLSAMTRRRAERTIREHGGHLCVRYASEESGEISFTTHRTRATSPRRQQRGAAALVARATALAATFSGLTAGCDVTVATIAHAMSIKGEPHIEHTMGEPAVELFVGQPAIREHMLGEVAPVVPDHPGEGSGELDGSGELSPEAAVLLQEQHAAEVLQPFGIALEEEEIEGCEADELTDEPVLIEPTERPLLMGRIAPDTFQLQKPR